MIMQQWNASAKTRHSYTLVYQFLTDLGLEMLRDIQFGLPAILNNSLASYRTLATIITRACIDVRKWAWQPKNLRVRVVHLS